MCASRRPDDRPRVFRGAKWSIDRRRPTRQPPPAPPARARAQFGELCPLLAAHRSTSTSVVSELCRRPLRSTPRRPLSSRSWRSASSRARFARRPAAPAAHRSRGRLRCHRRSSRRRRRRRRRRLALFERDLAARCEVREVREISEYHPLRLLWVCVWYVCACTLFAARVCMACEWRGLIFFGQLSRSLVLVLSLSLASLIHLSGIPPIFTKR